MPGLDQKKLCHWDFKARPMYQTYLMMLWILLWIPKYLSHTNTHTHTTSLTRSKLYTNTNKILQNIKHRKQYSWDLKWKKEWERFLWMCKGYKIYKLEWEMKNKEGNTKIFQSFCFCQQLLLPLGLKERQNKKKRWKWNAMKKYKESAKN